MTRKDVCSATGLSVKTLRLYEEKGLIAPEKQRKNGKDFWVYTPELVSQLERIALLRRALFTMDEIRTMQEHPEEISGIVRRYQQWLRLQEEQLHQLRQAADTIRPEDLSGVDGLIAQLQGAAAAMPLPATDIKPNFKRLDEMDEGPRHVELQRDLDDMVPNATVFRQVNIMVDRDRGNDANLALGQLQATVRGFQEEAGSGPVRGKQAIPKWRRILSGCLTALLPVLLILVYFSNEKIVIPGVLFWVDLGLLALLWAIPAWMAHRKWLREAQQADAENTSPDAYQRARKKRILLACAGAAGILAIALGFYALAQVLYAQAHPPADYRVCFAAPYNCPKSTINILEETLSPLVGDLDGNGNAYAAADPLNAQSDELYYVESRGDLQGPEYLEHCVETGQYILYFMSDYKKVQYNICTDFPFEKLCRELPPDLADPKDPYRVDLRSCAAFQKITSFYGCISLAATDEEYEFAVDLLRSLLDG